MALFIESLIRNRYQEESRSRILENHYFSASTYLNENRHIANSKKIIDIFFSHGSNDKEIIAGLTLILQIFGYSVCFDWNDPKLNRNNVSLKRAAILRENDQSKRLIYSFTEIISDSNWMPWVLVFFDGLKDSRKADLPISKRLIVKGQSVLDCIIIYNLIIVKEQIKMPLG